ncbi:MAG: SpoIID/LytB domain-containing protein [Candidatus Gracilibacteria bacterium]
MKHFFRNICAVTLLLSIFSQYQVPFVTFVPKVEAEFISPSAKSFTLPYVSEVTKTENEFNAIVAAWENPSTNFVMEIRTQQNNQWGEWKEVLLNHDGEDEDIDTKRFSEMQSVSPTNTFQYKITGLDDAKNIEFDNFDFLSFHEKSHVTFTSNIPSASAKIDGIIVTREEWGADPAWIEKESWDKERAAVCKAKPWYCGSSAASEKAIEEKAKQLAADFPDDVKTDSRSTTLNGKEVMWAISKSAKIKKIFVHHTAELNKDLNKDGVIDTQDEKMVMRNNYYFHSLVRGWGDIGYNYVVGSTGTIYEGRAGGDKVVAAHAVWRNISSTGISTMGNFEEENILTPQYTGLANAIGYVAKKYDLDPLGQSLFYGQTASTVQGHRDSEEAATACPGRNLYAKLPELRKLAALAKDQFLTVQSVEAGGFMQADVAKNGVGGSFIPQASMTSFGPQETKSIAIQVKNTGTVTWNKGSYLRITSQLDGVFIVQSGEKIPAKAAYLTETSVAPGGTGTFLLTLTSQYKKYTDAISFDAVINGSYLLKPSFIQVSAPDAILAYEVQNIVQPKKELIYGEETKILLMLKNTSNVAWNNSTIKLRNQNNAAQEFLPNGDGLMREAIVKPGETATFEVSLRAPIKTVNFDLNFLPVIQNAPSFTGPQIRVIGAVVHPALAKNFLLEQVSTTATTIRMGNTGMVTITLKNNSSEPWTGLSKYDIKPIFVSASPFIIPVSTVRFDRDYMNPGDTINVQIPVQASYTALSVPPLLQLKYLDLPLTKNPLNFPLLIPEETLKASYAASGNSMSMELNKQSTVQVLIQNTGTLPWKKDQVQLTLFGDSSNIRDASWIGSNVIGTFDGTKDIEPQQFALFKFSVYPKQLNVSPVFKLQFTNGPIVSIDGTLTIPPVKNSSTQSINGGAVEFGRSINRLVPTVKLFESGKLASASSTVQDTTFLKPIRIKLSYAETATTIQLKDSAYRLLMEGNTQSIIIPANSDVTLNAGSTMSISTGGKTYQATAFSFLPVKSDGKFSIPAWTRGTDKSTMFDNTFRSQLDIRKEGTNILYINTLSLENYLKGVAELPSSDPLEKQKALTIIARSYALFYQNPANKRTNQSTYYDMSDDPNEYQRYRGYAFEMRNATWLSAISATTNKVLTYNTKLIKPPFFSESDGRTRSAQEIWGWTNTPYLVSVSDITCKEGKGEMKGHGVGLSGCGAYGMASAGKTYQEIISYYYKGIAVSDITATKL